MKYCVRCKVIIENKAEHCPLCHKNVIKKGKPPEWDFPYQKNIKNNLNKYIIRVLAFLYIALIGLNVVLNLAFSHKKIWAPFSIIILLYIYLIVKTAIISYRNIGTIVVLNVYMLSLVGFILDLILGYSGWSIDYLMPILILAGIISLIVLTFIKPFFFENYFIYMLTITFFGIIQLVFLLTGLVNYKVISVITFFVSLLTVIGMFVFGDKKAINEFIKRFHY